MITSPRRIARMFSAHERSMRATESDPMNDHCQCMGEIYDWQNRNWRTKIWRATGLDEYEASVIAANHMAAERAKRQQHKNPLRLAWKKKNHNERLLAYNIRVCEEAFSWGE